MSPICPCLSTENSSEMALRKAFSLQLSPAVRPFAGHCTGESFTQLARAVSWLLLTCDTQNPTDTPLHPSLIFPDKPGCTSEIRAGLSSSRFGFPNTNKIRAVRYDLEKGGASKMFWVMVNSTVHIHIYVIQSTTLCTLSQMLTCNY